MCSGWYADFSTRQYKVYGDDRIRGDDGFRSLWLEGIRKFIAPEILFVVDSASPKKAQDEISWARLEKCELQVNPGHSQTTSKHYCGWTASVLIGLEYCLNSDAPYFLYIEQDALVSGTDFIPVLEEALSGCGILFGAPATNGLIEQSLFAIRKDMIRKFISRLHKIRYSDKEISPEIKFMLASSRMSWYPVGLMSWNRAQKIRKTFTKIFLFLVRYTKQYNYLPFGYGRVRPLKFGAEPFYFQHGTSDEIAKYEELLKSSA
ncbi:hypothetical protein [Pseudacidovorax intermedius]|uniref:hypothetical protein n=1 Tax=Pseudacidovorax intermedius TaxID=433924 RepID=UPI0012DF4A49|nr:hypothetical protein [Pseudacidovorax intermedius]